MPGDSPGVDGKVTQFMRDTLSPWGPMVLVWRLPVGQDPDIADNWLPETMPAMVAVDSVMFDPRNGVEFARAKIKWLDYLDVYSSSGGGFAAEWLNVKLLEPPSDDDLVGDIGWKSG